MQKANDILVDSDGDITVDESGDIDLATPLQTVQQDIIFRGKTAHLDFGPDPFIGANLGAYKGHPNNKRTGSFLAASMLESLTRDGRFTQGQVVVDAVPVSKTAIALVVFVRDAIAETEDEIINRGGIPVVTFVVDVDTAQITSITGGLR